MKIIIAGAGKVGTMLTKKLLAEGHEITLIDRNQQVVEQCTEDYDVMAVHGNCASMQVLDEADVKHTDLLIATAGQDEHNLLCCMTAHGMNSNIHTIARIRTPEYADQIYKMRDIFALSMTVNPEKQAAMEIERIIKYPGFLRRDTFAKGRAEMVELKVKADSKLCNHTLAEMSSIVKTQVLVCAVRREGEAIAPDGNFVLKEGDHIYVTASFENLTKLLRNLGIITHRARRVMICGGGRVGYYLASRLDRIGIDVQLIESNYDRCVELTSMMPGVSVICGDASNQTVLESEGLGQCDAVVAVTSFDEMNMIISLYAKNGGVEQVVTKVDHTDNTKIQDILNLDAVINPKEICCNEIVRYIRAMKAKTGAALSVHSFANGQMEAMEFAVDSTTMNCGIPLRDLWLRKNCIVACISHSGHVEIPNGDSCFKKGDIMVVVTSGDTVINQLNDIFVER